jgi:antitoxin ParD1/3/4
MDNPNTTMTVTLGDLAEKVEERVRSGEYDSASEVVRAGLEALEREERAFNAVLKVKVEEALADPRPWLSADEMSVRMRAYHEEQSAKTRDPI